MSIWRILCCRLDQPENLQLIDTLKKKQRVSKTRKKQEEDLHTERITHSLQQKNVLKIQVEEKQSSRSIVEPETKKEIKNIYEGEELDSIPHGTGTMLYSNGDYYRGEWVNGLKEGRGIQNYFEIDLKYEGQWKKGQLDGQGKLIQQNGSYYFGEFKKGKKHGKGEYFDSEKQTLYIQIYQNGLLLQKKQSLGQKQKHEQFPTLVLDKQRFNTLDLQKFEDENPQIQQLDLEFLLKYYGLCKIISLPFIDISIVDWNISQVLKFLEEIGLKDYRSMFYENKIKGKDLINLQQQEMKADLKMKLGDRKKLVNYIKYLYNLNKPKKTSNQKKTKRRGSFTMKQKDRLKFSILSVEQRISQAEDQDEGWKQDKEQSSKVKGKGKKNFNVHNGFDTDGWDQYNSNINNDQYHSQQNKSQTSNAKIKGSDNERNDEIQIPSYKRRKKSQNKQESHTNKLVNFNNQGRPLEKLDKQSRSSSSSSNSGGQIRELYQFLKQNKSLDFIIKKKDIQIIERIGEGGYGQVYRGKYMSCPVAVKDYMKAGRGHKSRQDFMKQVYILSDLKHPNIVLYMGMCITVDQYQLVTQYMDNGSLFDQVHQKKTRFSNNEQFEIIDDIVKGMVYLHNMKNMLHRDLKSSNVLIAEDWKVKLCDFGLSGHKKKKKKKKKSHHHNRIGTYQWMAPQVIRNQQVDFHSDVYSFGVVLWEILTENIPYQGLSEVQIVGLVGYDEKHRLPKPQKDVDQCIVGIMEKCLERDPTARPTFIQIQNILDQQRVQRGNMRVDWSSK